MVVSEPSQLKPARKVFIFGPQVLSLDADASRKLILQLNATHNSWILQLAATLPSLWKSLTDNVPKLKCVDGESLLRCLLEGLRTGLIWDSLDELPNVLLSPLTVIAHIVQFSTFLRSAGYDFVNADVIPASLFEDAEAWGLCTGTLSAYAAACSSSFTDLQRYGAAAIRLALLSGAVIDAENLGDRGQGKSSSISVSWTGAENGAVDRILQGFPDAYVSVCVDEKRLTITASKATLPTLIDALKTAGKYVTDVKLAGRFHWPEHENDVQDLLRFCDSDERFQFPDASKLLLPSTSETETQYLRTGNLHDIALRDILLNRSNWVHRFTTLLSRQSPTESPKIVCFGPERCVPPSIARRLHSCLTYFSDIETPPSLSSDVPSNDGTSHVSVDPHDERIAVVGMSCRTAGANDLEEFWKVLSSGQSQHVEVPAARFSMETPWRNSDIGHKWYGNFIQGIDHFDHKFFKKSPREMASTDPQQRLALQAAYQAVEQSGYYDKFHKDKHIGCYVGISAVDYERNVACYPANAYTAKGNIKSFVAGNISHYFGWTGPSMTLDTACSASGVAIHQACRAVLGGECTAALAGGVNALTSPDWFYNLAGATFLSPTGQCKPFDADADGYCRGEGVGFVLLKRLSQAIADGDQVFGVIASTRVYQNQNFTAITVPNAPSLSGLFQDVVRQAKIEPRSISFVEAHGTGTPVGDPAEYDAIRTALGGPSRPDTLYLSSVKGSVGHCEVASGVVSLAKVLLMIYERSITPQASFSSISPGLKASPEDKVEIPTSIKPWRPGFYAALINNYGASGSNASMIVTQPPHNPHQVTSSATPLAQSYPFWFSAFDNRSLQAYAAKFRHYLQRDGGSLKDLSLRDISFGLSRQSNRSLSQSLILTAKTIDELQNQLLAFERGDKGMETIHQQQPSRPVILCFGGQVSTFVGLEQTIYDNFTVFRNHLDQCNTTCISMGLDSIYPTIFQRSPVQNLVKLQCVLFAMQYSCAMSWIDCGVQVAAVVGHSFGELAALCVAGVLSLHDAIKLVSGRASIIERCWGSEKGSMIAVEAAAFDIEDLLTRARKASGSLEDPSIACYNGPRSFTVAGSERAIRLTEELIGVERDSSKFRAKRLNVTNAYHSALVDPLMSELELLGRSITYKEPVIRCERATENTVRTFGASFVAEHMRKPVYFNHAVQRLAQDFPSAIWLEAGSNSTVTNMASRALGGLKSAHFQSMNLTDTTSIENLVSSTAKLWKAGLNVSYWAHHRTQTDIYASVLLPPYQFAETEHWMEIKDVPKPQDTATEGSSTTNAPLGLTTFIGYQDKDNRSARFQVNTSVKEFQQRVKGIFVAQTIPVPPSMLQLDVVLHALRNLRPELQDGKFTPEMRRMSHQNVWVLDTAASIYLDATASDAEGLVWQWVLSSTTSSSPSITYTTGTLTFNPSIDVDSREELESMQRMVSRKRCTDLLDDIHADEVLQGRSIYRVYDSIVKWGSPYRKLTKIAAKGSEAAGRIDKSYAGGAWLDSVLSDCFSQVPHIHINLMMEDSEASNGDIFICNKVGRWIRNSAVNTSVSQSDHWEVFATHHRVSQSVYVSDVFAFDPQDGSLVEAVLGITYQRTSLDILRRNVPHISPDNVSQQKAVNATPQKLKETPGLPPPTLAPTSLAVKEEPSMSVASQQAAPTAHDSSSSHISGKTREILCNLSGLEPEEIQEDSDLIELGIDSLMAMEVIREVEAAFHCTLSNDQLMEISEFRELVACISSTLGLANGHVEGDIKLAAPLETSKANGTAGEAQPGDESEGAHSTHNNQRSVISNSIGTGSETVGYGASLNGTVNFDGPVFIDDKNHDRHYSAGQPVSLPENTLLEVFREVKWKTDDFISQGQLGHYLDKVAPRSTELCIVYILDAFEHLGDPIRTAATGQRIRRVSCLPKHEKQLSLLYRFLEREARLIDFDGDEILRTAISPPSKSAEVLLAELLRDEPVHAADHKLTALLGRNLSDCLTGKTEGAQLMFTEGRELMTQLYAGSPFMGVSIIQLEYFLRKLLEKLPPAGEPLCVLEIGAGTGGTTSGLLPMLAAMGRPIKYTMTDLSGSLVAASRKRFKHLGFMDFKVLDIESEPDASFLQSQHIILSTNCIHATRKISVSLSNVHRMLRPDGFLMILELSERVPWVDFVFGLVEGWWLFEDDRDHALSPPTHWENVLHSVGYGHVDWSDGDSPEANIQRMIIAHKSGARHNRAPKPPSLLQAVPTASSLSQDAPERQAVIDAYIEKHIKDFTVQPKSVGSVKSNGISSGRCVLVTGATGSLGAHIVAHLASLADIRMVVCLNRLSNVEATLRQRQSLERRGIRLDATSMAKLNIIATDTSKSMLGLSPETYEFLAHNVTHIVHSAWPMSLTRPLRGYEIQFKIIRHLIDLASQASAYQPATPRIGFQFISSIATVANYPLWTGEASVPEKLTNIEIVPPGGYPQAKVVCEYMLSRTLYRHPEHFHVMVSRIAQISGSATSGHWNPTEYVPLLVKSSQVLRVLPDLDGTLSWCPVDQVAATLSELLTSATGTELVYHIDNPSRQPWKHVIDVLARTLGIPRQGGVVPYAHWVDRVRRFRAASVNDNPALQLIGYWDTYFIPMSCGDLLLDVANTVTYSDTLRTMRPIDDDLLVKYVESWKQSGFLYN